uniref:Uncharacterized protein n=2 Tax=Odontella aurita TaxID=265563 RepID=A0A7S4K6S8_9STRA|mmetsp:Transcript_62935/g.185880  ORF Transcript_62935/g.185880 Transcript_62935/m.185880 type:complete len:278 (+) Transcript_62935:464-1297(+)
MLAQTRSCLNFTAAFPPGSQERGQYTHFFEVQNTEIAHRTMLLQIVKFEVVSLFLLLSLATCLIRVSAETGGHYGQCKKICKEFFENDLGTQLCQPALNIMPRPGVYKACINGRALGFEHACIPSCMGEKVVEADSFKACKSEGKRARPNHQLPWCRRGYDVTFDETKEKISNKAKELLKRTERSHESMSGERRYESEPGPADAVLEENIEIQVDSPKTKIDTLVTVTKEENEYDREPAPAAEHVNLSMERKTEKKSSTIAKDFFDVTKAESSTEEF